MNIRQQLDGVLSKEMDRRNFLQYIGIVLLSLLGVTGLIRALLAAGNKASLGQTNASTASHGYGASRYGE